MILSDRQAVWALALGQTLVWAGLYYIFPALIVYWEDGLGWSRADLTAGFTMAILSSAALSPFAGRIVDADWGPYLLAGSCFLGGVILSSLYFISDLWLFYTVWILLGICMAGALYEPCFSFLVRVKGLKAQRYITIITLVAGFAGTLSFPLNHFVADLAGWRVAVLVFVVLVCFGAAPLIWLGASSLLHHAEPDEHHDDTPKDGQADRHRYAFLAEGAFWFLALSFAFIYTTHTALINHLLLLLKDREFDPELAVLAASFMGPMQVAGRLAIFAVEKHVSRIMVAGGCFVFSLMAVICLYYAGTYPWLLIPSIILQGSGIGVMSIMKPVVSREVMGGKNFGTISGAISVPFFTGAAFSAYLASLLWEQGGYDLVILVMMGIVALGFASFVMAVRSRRRAVS